MRSIHIPAIRRSIKRQSIAYKMQFPVPPNVTLNGQPVPAGDFTVGELFTTFANASDVLSQINRAIGWIGGAFGFTQQQTVAGVAAPTILNAITDGDMDMYSITPEPVAPFEPSNVGLFEARGFFIKNGRLCEVWENMSLYARGWYPDEPLDHNYRVIGSGSGGTIQAFPTVIKLQLVSESYNGLADLYEAYWSAPSGS